MDTALMHDLQHFATPNGGRLTVLAGQVWLTRQNDLQDHVLTAGQTLELGPGDDVVVESLVAGPTRLRWDAPPAPVYLADFLRGAWAGGLRRAARGLGAAAAGLEALARTAAATANRAQGCIRSCDSMASSGTVQ
jgi:Protein of unknown function (DUF2917)